MGSGLSRPAGRRCDNLPHAHTGQAANESPHILRFRRPQEALPKERVQLRPGGQASKEKLAHGRASEQTDLGINSLFGGVPAGCGAQRLLNQSYLPGHRSHDSGGGRMGPEEPEEKCPSSQPEVKSVSAVEVGQVLMVGLDHKRTELSSQFLHSCSARTTARSSQLPTS